MELRPKIFGARICLRNNCDLKITYAELCDVALLLVVGGVGLDLLRNPGVGHCANVRFKKKMQ